MSIEPFIETLFRPLEQGRITVAEPVVYANAMPGLPEISSAPPRIWQPLRDRMLDGGWATATPGGAPLADAETNSLQNAAAGAQLAILPMRKERDASQGIAAHLWSGLAAGGVLLGAAPNNGGAKSYEKAFGKAFGSVESLSKNKARAFWSRKSDQAPPADWLAGYAIQTNGAGYLTRPGVFSADHADAGSALLLESIDEVSGHVHDLGAGWGYLTAELAKRGAAADSWTLWENDREALALAARNVEVDAAFHWADVTRECVDNRADTVVMNPPFHQGWRTEIDLGIRFIEVASNLLKSGGTAWIVANRHLPYEDAVRRLFSSEQIAAERDGFKVIRATK